MLNKLFQEISGSKNREIYPYKTAWNYNDYVNLIKALFIFNNDAHFNQSQCRISNSRKSA